MKLDIVFESANFVILDKPAMVLTTPSRESKTDPRECLGLRLQEHLKQQIYPVHRLDFEVSGLVLFAKTAEAHRQANSWFENKCVFKTYEALSERQSFKHIPLNIKNSRLSLDLKVGDSFLWKSRLLRGKKRAYEHPTGKLSETQAIHSGRHSSQQWECWTLNPLTGRPHQLRYELSSHGFPILGDSLYGSTLPYDKPGIALRAVKIDFRHVPDFNKTQLPQEIILPGL